MLPLQMGPDVYLNALRIEAAPTGRTHCKACKKTIGMGEARVAFHRSMASSHFFHLYCFTPITKVRICTNLRFTVVGSEIQDEVKEWINDWNRQFDFKEEEIEQYAQKKVHSKSPPLRRVLLEAFKFLDVLTIVNLVCGICKAWYHVTWEDELWRLLGQAQFPDLSMVSECRKEFIGSWMHSCVHCGKQLLSEQRHMICPLTKRPKCLKCYSDPIYRPQRLPWVASRDLLSRSFLNKLKVPRFEFDGSPCIYLYMAQGKAAKHRKALAEAFLAREDDQLDAVFSKELFAQLRNASEQDFLTPEKLRSLVTYYSLSDAQKSLIDFILSGNAISKFKGMPQASQQEQKNLG